ncbi:MAG TPA: Rieske 2Fe-2S domain-containing protein [Gemmatimonadales bacterium]|nr:Rieske 2Fe-2S domain-containing protein [Gemmatimonadales bacterium]
MTQQVLPEIEAIKSGAMERFDIAGRPITIANVDGRFYAFDDACTHLHCSLAKGRLTGTTVKCACHGSEFDVRSGQVLKGPANQPVLTYRVDPKTDTLQVDS